MKSFTCTYPTHANNSAWAGWTNAVLAEGDRELQVLCSGCVAYTVANPPPLTPADIAATNLQTLLPQQSTFTAQMQTDVAMFQATPVGSTIQQEHIDAFVRMVEGFGTAMGAIVDHLVLTGLA